MLIYLHGFRSGPQSGKLLALQQRMAELGCADQLWGEQLRWGPDEAIAQLSAVIEASATPPTLVGSSLGGFYAAHLAERFDLRAVLINPAIAPHRLLSQWLGTQTQIYTGECFEVHAEHMEALRALQVTHYRSPDKLWLMVETGDETLDYREAVAHFAGARQDIFPGGDHRFSRWEACIDDVLRFAGLLST
ncbi:YqiA/YcfP family alpha/beta fold hydrolase [Viridibacterium curvum]|uniref:Alpha/beta fold hydrolase n=1 Tax=Viridibacterium curvum TaxID=1101404 RepID=A0ABP9R0D4_9RHOO